MHNWMSDRPHHFIVSRTRQIMRTLVVWLGASALLLVHGCSTWQAPGYHKPLAEQIAVGNVVRVELEDGTREEFVVTAVDQTGIYDDSRLYAFDDIALLKIKENAPERTATAMVVVSVVLGILVVSLFLDETFDLADDKIFD